MLGCVLAPANAAAATKQPKSSLVLSVYEGIGDTGPMIGEVTLKCDPPGGTHSAAEDACAALDAVDGNFRRLRSTGGMCIMIYAPVTVQAGGNWRDDVVRFERTYGNLCVAGTSSNGVFWL